jgi:hypothetical protein
MTTGRINQVTLLSAILASLPTDPVKEKRKKNTKTLTHDSQRLLWGAARGVLKLCLKQGYQKPFPAELKPRRSQRKAGNIFGFLVIFTA